MGRPGRFTAARTVAIHEPVERGVDLQTDLTAQPAALDRHGRIPRLETLSQSLRDICGVEEYTHDDRRPRRAVQHPVTPGLHPGATWFSQCRVWARRSESRIGIACDHFKRRRDGVRKML